ncbi:Na(+)/H(+) antiporter [Fusarium oxysporum f. sp. albedinis]|nr:Na(+)/H(+) antiporter [Fusarium oxysporum f. sp. albedinis]
MSGKIVSLETVFDSSFGLVVLFIVGIFSSGRLEIDLVIIRKYLGVMICAEPKRAASLWGIRLPCIGLYHALSVSRLGLS